MMIPEDRLRVKITLAYVGTAFAGWQIQSAGQRGVPPRTVQGELEAAIFRVAGETTRVHGAGRTDAGVHADMQTAHFDVPARLAYINWPAALQGILPPDLAVLRAEVVPPEFHARFSATGKVYTYLVSLSLRQPPPRWRPFIWNTGPLDLDLMDAAAAAFAGEHDFAAFQNAGNRVLHTVRRLDEVRRLPWNPFPELPEGQEGLYWAWRFTGSGFLKQMVRNLMGFLVEAGRGKLSREDAELLLAAKDRRLRSFASAPAKGLTLSRVVY